jgi:truncated hemoglobin YjbI
MVVGFVPSTLADSLYTATTTTTLYTQLSGYDALAAVTDDFITALATDPQLGKFFVGLNDESKKRVRQLSWAGNEDRAQGSAHHRSEVELVSPAPGRHAE